MLDVRCAKIKGVKLGFTLKIEGSFRRSGHFSHGNIFFQLKQLLRFAIAPQHVSCENVGNYVLEIDTRVYKFSPNNCTTS